MTCRYLATRMKYQEKTKAKMTFRCKPEFGCRDVPNIKTAQICMVSIKVLVCSGNLENKD